MWRASIAGETDMRLTSIGAQRNKGTKVHFTESDYASEPTVIPGESPTLRVWVDGHRRYKLFLTPADVIKFLLYLPPEAIAGAVAEAGEDVDLATQLPEVLKQLATGALTPTTAPSLLE
jgi:hypothetical protein